MGADEIVKGNSANIDSRKPIALTITLKYGDNTTAEDKTVGIELYRVGEWDGSQGKYVLTEEFAPAFASYLVSLPLWEENGGNAGYWDYDVEAVSKVRKDSPETPSQPSGDDGTTPLDGLNPPPERIEDGDVPLGDGPFQQLIEEVFIPLGLLPKTGDGSISYAPLLALMAASGLLIFGLIWRRVRKTR